MLSKKSCVWFADVRALKVMNTGTYVSGMWFDSLSMTLSVFPVPVSPTQSTCLSDKRSLSMTYAYRTVSAVGTMTCEKGASGFGTYSGIVRIHSTNLSSSWSKQYSYIEVEPLSLGGMCLTKSHSFAF